MRGKYFFAFAHMIDQTPDRDFLKSTRQSISPAARIIQL